MEPEAKKPKTEDNVGSADNKATRAAVHSLGNWVEDRNLTYIIRFKDKYLQRMGQSDGERLWLFPEEATFLVSQGRLHLQDATSGRLLERHEALSLCFHGKGR